MSARFAMRDCRLCDRQVLVTAEGRCPQCASQLVGDAAPSTVEVRLSGRSELPHVCLQCGAPTHRLARVRVRGRAPSPPPAAGRSEGLPAWVHLVAGPLGVLASLIGSLSSSLDRAGSGRPPRFALRVPQCAECARAGPPLGFAPDFDLRSLGFEAHPRFAEALGRAARDARRERTLATAPPRGDDDARPVSPS